jgi:hypothetical protein
MSKIGHYKLNDNAGNTIVIDSSGNTRNGTTNTNTSTLSVTGKINEALSLTTSDYFNLGTLSAWNFGTTDFSIAIWFKIGSVPSERVILAKRAWSLGTEDGYAIALVNSTTIRVHYNSDSDFTVSNIADDQWHHVVVNFDYTGSQTSLYLDGSLNATKSHTQDSQSNSNDLYIGRNQPNSVHFDGELDDLRIYDELLTTQNISDIYNSGSGTEADILQIIININESVIINDSAQTLETLLRMNESIIINDSQQEQSPIQNISENIVINETTDLTLNAGFGSKLLSYNPLIFVTNSLSPKIVKIDITDPENPTHVVYNLVGVTNATDIARNSITGFLYVACADGKVVKIDENNFNTQTIIDLSDTDDLLSIESMSSFGLTYTSTENTVGELYLIDERETSLGDLRLDVLVEKSSTLNSSFNTVEGTHLDANLQVLSYVTQTISCDFKCLTDVLSNIEPIKRTDFDIEINGSPLNQFDFDLKSITVQHVVDEQSTTSFNLCRRHDDPNKDLEGNISEITNQNPVTVKINGKTEFEGFITTWDAIYGLDQEIISITATSVEEKPCKFNSTTLSLPSLDKPLGLYDILTENATVFNPILDPDDDNPIRFKGIRIPLGIKTTQSFYRGIKHDVLGDDAKKINNNTFFFKQNNTYFWSPEVSAINVGEIKTAVTPVVETEDEGFKPPTLTFSFNTNSFFKSNTVTPSVDGKTSAIKFLYIGTSLSPVSEKLWVLSKASHKLQRRFDDITEELGVYEVGEAPFKEITTRNGKLVSKFHYVDKPDGLYSIKDSSYDFTDYVKQIADLEYLKIQNINGNILPETTCAIDITVDAYRYYDLNMLTRIKADNTTEQNVFTNSNGFPTAIKSITIDSGSMTVSLNTDNIKSNKELETIDGDFPDENSSEFIQKEIQTFVAQKSDMRSRLDVT